MTMRIVQTRLTLETEPRELKEITAEVAAVGRSTEHRRRFVVGVHLPHLGLAADSGKRIA